MAAFGHGKLLVSCMVSAASLVAAIFVVAKCLPACAPTLAWKSGWLALQEPAIPHLMKRLHVGMTYGELVGVMGMPPELDGQPLHDGIHSYNVDSWYNRGIDVTLSNGVVVSVFEYD